jgi:hypothetical protein
MKSAKDLMGTCAEIEGWSVQTCLELCLQFIDDEYSVPEFEAFLTERIEPKGEPAEDAGPDPAFEYDPDDKAHVYITGSCGQLVVDPTTGQVLRYIRDRDADDENNYDDIARIDLDEHRRNGVYPKNPDILDVGYWTRGGHYEPPTDYREHFLEDVATWDPSGDMYPAHREILEHNIAHGRIPRPEAPNAD